MADATVSIVKEECFLDEILNELPNKVAKPTPTVKGKNLSVSKLFHQISDSLKDLHLVYTCVDVSSVVIALGTNVGNAFIYKRNQRNILKISSDTKYVPTTCIKLAAGCSTVAFGHESGTFSVGLVDPPVHKSFDSLTAKDIHGTAVTCLEWSTDGLILYAGDSEGNISMSVVKITEGILQTAVIITEGDSIIQLSYASDSLLVSTIKRTLIWSFQTENLIQVGEKERKMKGSFGCCFIPDNLQEPSKKLYAVRPGQRIWMADGSGKVSSTSVFKSLLADKPQTIYTLTGNDKANSGGQFGCLLIYYKKFVVTWDQSHLWILDLDKGAVIGCHSNLGKICDVAVSGHELFVLLNQRERFLRRFTLVNEDLGPSSLDAVVAIPHYDVDESPLQLAEKSEERKTDDVSVVPATAVETQDKEDGKPLPETFVPADDIFQRINAISLDCEKGDIVFTGAKKKKKKKKAKQASDETKNLTENQGTSEPSTDNVSFAGSKDQTLSEETVSKNETPTAEIPIGSAQPASSSIVLEESKSETTIVTPLHSNTPTQNRSPVLPRVDIKDEPRSESPDEVTIDEEVTIDDQQAQEKESPVPAQGDEDIPHTVVHGAVAVSKKPTSENASSNIEEIRTSHELDETPKQASDQNSSEKTFSAQQLDTPSVLKVVNETNADEQDQDVTEETSILPIENKPEPEHSPLDSGNVPAASEITVAMSQSLDSMESGDEYRVVLEQTSDYLRSDSYQPESFGGHSKFSESKQSENKQQDEDPHAPMFADTWSKRAAPTVQAIESLAISEKYVFCLNARGEVYYSDPNTASCHGWEQTDWKAKQIYIDSSCKQIIYKGKKNKAFVRANVGGMHPVGSASYQIMEDVDLLASCSVCSWVISVNGDFKRADSSALVELKGDLKNPRIWRQEDLKENLCQIACYHDVLWGRTHDESLTVYTGRSGGKKAMWMTIEEKKAKWINMSDDGTIWIITPDDQIWFNPGISVSNPTGEVWYQVSLGEYIIEDESVLGSAYNFFQSVGSAYRNSRTTEYLRHAAKGLIQSTRDMAYSLFRDGGYPKQIYCNTQSGVWLLDTKNALHACRGQITGAYWKRVCPTGTAQSATWRQVSTGLGSYVWALQPNGELTCFNPNGPSYNVAGPSSKDSLDFITSSPHGVWCFSSNMPDRIYVRDGISEGYPQGFAWVSLSLRRHEIEDVKHISVGGITVWAVDNSGNVWLRIGSVHGDESTVQSQAWVPIDGPPHAELSTIEVNAKDSMVWVTDTKGNVYARDGIKDDYLIGNSWREVSGATLKSVCLSSCVVYGLCTNGEIVCRFGVSPTNCSGDYWKKIPGNFAQMSVNDAGELWVISEEDWLFARKTKCLFAKLASKNTTGKQDVARDKKNFVQVVDVGDVVDGGSDGDDGGDWELL